MHSLPDTRGVPLGKAPPAGHPRPAAHLLGEILPGDTGLQDEDDAGEDPAVGDPLAPGVSVPPLDDGQLGLDASPQVVRDEMLCHVAGLRHAIAKSLF